ncbi:oxidoreductase, acting on single donors with incorporation of molecular oxygen, incorporation of two atoms of oxygen [Arthrobacter sp. Hiyo4]|nr:oxidoreductase, acting on single donors with incorporation of molecular oxygen, incorporation of two atoms of oxygen [Arthrobacter sp. Hiyo4]
MQLGAFSISLTVKDIAASAAFYEKLGFISFGGDIIQNWLIPRTARPLLASSRGCLRRTC